MVKNVVVQPEILVTKANEVNISVTFVNAFLLILFDNADQLYK